MPSTFVDFLKAEVWDSLEPKKVTHGFLKLKVHLYFLANGLLQIKQKSIEWVLNGKRDFSCPEGFHTTLWKRNNIKNKKWFRAYHWLFYNICSYPVKVTEVAVIRRPVMSGGQIKILLFIVHKANIISCTHNGRKYSSGKL